MSGEPRIVGGYQPDAIYPAPTDPPPRGEATVHVGRVVIAGGGRGRLCDGHALHALCEHFPADKPCPFCELERLGKAFDAERADWYAAATESKRLRDENERLRAEVEQLRTSLRRVSRAASGAAEERQP